jgi:hypothetical protein
MDARCASEMFGSASILSYEAVENACVAQHSALRSLSHDSTDGEWHHGY